jgi:hypothetical protein
MTGWISPLAEMEAESSSSLSAANSLRGWCGLGTIF